MRYSEIIEKQINFFISNEKLLIPRDQSIIDDINSYRWNQKQMREIIVKKTIAVYGSHKVFTDTVKLEKYNNNLCLNNGFIGDTKRYITNEGIEFIYIAHPSDGAWFRFDDYQNNTPYKNNGIPTTSEMEIIRFLKFRLK